MYHISGPANNIVGLPPLNSKYFERFGSTSQGRRWATFCVIMGLSVDPVITKASF